MEDPDAAEAEQDQQPAAGFKPLQPPLANGNDAAAASADDWRHAGGDSNGAATGAADDRRRSRRGDVCFPSNFMPLNSCLCHSPVAASDRRQASSHICLYWRVSGCTVGRAHDRPCRSEPRLRRRDHLIGMWVAAGRTARSPRREAPLEPVHVSIWTHIRTKRRKSVEYCDAFGTMRHPPLPQGDDMRWNVLAAHTCVHTMKNLSC